MKKLIAIAFILALCSCKKCYQCFTTSIGYRVDGSIYGQSTSESNFCGTNFEKTKHEKENTHTVPGQSNSKLVTQTTCKAE
jgi:hypothetical protein